MGCNINTSRQHKAAATHSSSQKQCGPLKRQSDKAAAMDGDDGSYSSYSHLYSSFFKWDHLKSLAQQQYPSWGPTIENSHLQICYVNTKKFNKNNKKVWEKIEIKSRCSTNTQYKNLHITLIHAQNSKRTYKRIYNTYEYTCMYRPTCLHIFNYVYWTYNYTYE